MEIKFPKASSSSNSANLIGDLFLQLWEEAISIDPATRSRMGGPMIRLQEKFAGALQIDGESDAYQRIQGILKPSPGATNFARNLILEAMRAIDDCFMRIHPRIMRSVNSPKLPLWLREYDLAYKRTGAYFRGEKYNLVPRGPLCSTPREEDASSADSLSDRFTALTAQQKTFSVDGHALPVANIAISSSVVHGVPQRAQYGNEGIAIVPIAEVPDDLLMTVEFDAPRGFVRFAPRLDVGFSEKILSALRANADCDICVAPEFTATLDEIERLRDALLEANFPAPALVVAGTGERRVDDEPAPRNSCQILNGIGAVLWTQEKLWPARMDKNTADSYGVETRPGVDTYIEYNAAGSEIVVADIDGFGRCLVLICQDLQIADCTRLLQETQPDWVFVPILDRGANHGRWAHQRAFELSGHSFARFIIASSRSVGVRADPGLDNEPAIGLFVGPKDEHEGCIGRAVAEVRLDRNTEKSWAFRKWSATVSGKQSTLASVPPRRADDTGPT